jgi:diadenylate cyclase
MVLFNGVKGYISDAVDIIIVSFIFYHLLLLLRGTRAVQLLKGISVVVVLWLISRYFELRTLTWLIENLFSVGVIALIVIFQPELRRALEQIGRGGFFSQHRTLREEEVSKLVGELSKAVSVLSMGNIGGLIVIERTTGLSEYIRTGVVLQADISSELIRTIFSTNTPLHDGAIIIQEQKIMAAGCFLPLTENTRISKTLGTRHRAAIGMTEVSDAIVIVLSEESGQISLAINGVLEQNLTEEAFMSRLFQLVKPMRSWVKKESGIND